MFSRETYRRLPLESCASVYAVEDVHSLRNWSLNSVTRKCVNSCKRTAISPRSIGLKRALIPHCLGALSLSLSSNSRRDFIQSFARSTSTFRIACLIQWKSGAILFRIAEDELYIIGSSCHASC